ncbi:hypothetical protein LWI28_023334 [Acer negundo]|uniref:RING-type E3 ubiquitin transferase n=1 Tax=Acer negundo TaxID=4023 RepID=A0AAD5IGT4_ACENE|nr:hypothetical protein LWI28_023334 [Acer negundo]
MAKFSVGRLEEEGEGPSSRTQKRQRRESEPQTAVIEGITDEELEATVDYLVEEEDGEGNNQEFEQRGSAANNRDRTDVVGPSRNGSISVTLTDPEVLDCFICFDPLTIPVFQCENGHVACSFCCSKLRNKCPSCCSPIGYNRCRAIEKVLESVKVICKNSKYGCKETMSYSQRHDHEKTCQHAPCWCPLSDCGFVGTCSRLYQHFMDRHKSSAVQFRYNKVCHVALNINVEFLVLQEEIDGALFILHNRSEIIGNVISLSCIAPSQKGGCFYDILARPGGSTVRFQSYTNSMESRINCPPLVQGSLLVPSSFFDSHGLLKLDLCIWRYGISPKLIQRIIV